MKMFVYLKEWELSKVSDQDSLTHMKGTYRKKQVNLSLPLIYFKECFCAWRSLQLQSIMTQKSGRFLCYENTNWNSKNKFVIMNGVKYIIENKKLNSE